MNTLSSLQKSIVGILQLAPNPISMNEILEKIGVDRQVSRATAQRAIAPLLHDDRVEVFGGGPATKYTINSVYKWFLKDAKDRPSVSYDPSLLQDYKPNVTNWLGADDRKRLRECQSGIHEAGTFAKSITQKLMIELSYASSALEGNTYNYLDTETLIKYGQAASGKEHEETQMILNHKDAVSYLFDVYQDHEISPRTVKEFHSLLGQGLIRPEQLGQLRSKIVEIGGSSYTPLHVPSQLHEEFEKLIEKSNQINDPFEQSFFLMTMVSYLQPFIDVNKRTGRLLSNIPLLKNGLSPMSFLMMDKALYVRGLLEFYELKSIKTIKNAYMSAYEATAAKYVDTIGLDPLDIQIDQNYKNELNFIIKNWLETTVNNDPERFEDVVSNQLSHIKDEKILLRIKARAEELLRGLNEGNRILYGVSRQLFDQYTEKGLSVKKLKPK